MALFEAVLATGRCYYESAEWGFQLSHGPAREFTFKWQMDDFGYQRGQWSTTPAADILLPLTTPWYLDRDACQSGQLDCDLPVEVIDELVAIAPVSPDKAAALNEKLLRDWPKNSIPPLQSVEVDVLPRVKPVPCLRLKSEERQQAWGEDDKYRNFAILTFAYENEAGTGVEIERHGPSTRTREGQLIQVQRDEAAETAIVQQLYTLGFEDADDE